MPLQMHDTEDAEDNPQIGALRIAQFRNQNDQMRQRMATKKTTPEQLQQREQRRQESERKKAEAIANVERDAPIRARFHAWLEASGFRKYETPSPGSSYPGSHIETLWDAYIDATMKEREATNAQR